MVKMHCILMTERNISSDFSYSNKRCHIQASITLQLAEQDNIRYGNKK